MGFLYTIFVGIPLCVMLMGAGVFFCCTIIGLPIGLTCFALGFKVLTIQPPPRRQGYKINVQARRPE